MKKKVPDDVILVFCGIFTGLLYLWTQQGCVYSGFDFWIYIGAVMGFFVVPMVYSSIVYYQSKK